MATPFEVVVNDHALTGESPMWSVRERALYWLDGRRDAIYRIEIATGARASWTTPAKVNALGLRRGGGLIAAMKGSVATLDTASGTFAHLLDPEPDRPHARMNDGKVDRAGRFWFSTMEDDAKEPIGRVYSLAPDGTLATHDDGFTIPNGFGWSPDDRTMYLADSHLGRIYAYDYDAASAKVTNRRTFVDVPKGGRPDGATVDSRGYVWSAWVGGGALQRFAPDGSVDRTLELPMTRPTSVIFGGDDLRTLYITSSSRGLTPEQLAAQDLAGAVLAVRVDVPGLPESEFG